MYANAVGFVFVKTLLFMVVIEPGAEIASLANVEIFMRAAALRFRRPFRNDVNGSERLESSTDGIQVEGIFGSRLAGNVHGSDFGHVFIPLCGARL